MPIPDLRAAAAYQLEERDNMNGEGWMNIGRKPMAWGPSWQSVPQSDNVIKQITCPTGEQYYACLDGFRGCATHNPCVSTSTSTAQCTKTTVATVSHTTTQTANRAGTTSSCTSTHTSALPSSTHPVTAVSHSDPLKVVSQTICTSSHGTTSTCTSAHPSTTCTSIHSGSSTCTLPHSTSICTSSHGTTSTCTSAHSTSICTSSHGTTSTCTLPHSTSICTSSHGTTSTCTSAHSTSICTSSHGISTTCTLPHSTSICTSSHSGSTTCTSQHPTTTCTSIHSGTSTTCTLPHSTSSICTSSHGTSTTCTSLHASQPGKIETRLSLPVSSSTHLSSHSTQHSTSHSTHASTHSTTSPLPSALVCPHANNTIHECGGASYKIRCQADSNTRSYHKFSVGAGGYAQCFDWCSTNSKCAGFTFVGEDKGDCLFKSSLPASCYVPKKEPGHITCAKQNHTVLARRSLLESDVTDKGAVIGSGLGLFLIAAGALLFILWIRGRRGAQNAPTVLRARRRTSAANYDEPPSPLPMHEDGDDVFSVPPPYREVSKSTSTAAGVQPVPAQHHARQRSIYKNKNGGL